MRQEEIRFKVDIPDGYEFVAWRYATYGDKYLPGNGDIGHWNLPESLEKKIIVKKAKRWRPANESDMVAVMRGQTVEARFRNDDSDGWFYGDLRGWWNREDSGISWYSRSSWDYCEVKE